MGGGDVVDCQPGRERKLTDPLLWHEILAAVMRRYGGRSMPTELVVTLPDRPTGGVRHGVQQPNGNG